MPPPPPPPRRPPRLRPGKPGPPRPPARPGAPDLSAPPWRRPGWPRRPRRTPTPERARGRPPTASPRTSPAPGRPRRSRPPTARRTSTRWPPWVSATRGDPARWGARRRPGSRRQTKGLCAVARPPPGEGPAWSRLLGISARGSPCALGPPNAPRLGGLPSGPREPPHLRALCPAPPKSPVLDLPSRPPATSPVSGPPRRHRTCWGHVTLRAAAAAETLADLTLARLPLSPASGCSRLDLRAYLELGGQVSRGVLGARGGVGGELRISLSCRIFRLCIRNWAFLLSGTDFLFVVLL